MRKRKIKVGLDFDGVVAYNPFRIIRAPLTYFKRQILGVKKLSFWYPEKKWQQVFWQILHESSVFPAKGTELLKELTEKNIIEADLITARFSFLDDQLDRWLRKNNLRKCFRSVNINNKDEQPHIFKEKMLIRLKPDYYIEDNWDIVSYLSNRQKKDKILRKIKIYWIYNIVDRRNPYNYKFPYLERALEEVIRKSD
ncbi:hypothetical protein A2Y99_00715 [Candidatus Gottesmanbacteria bacterium RBG_13_37_7]|uniref:Nucleotidase n=1 Tax=Candidatus Gottesmanbacteria bacterium RBG_13_37_7 TaxID=1798369 RepID=A0A1F5YGX2_9BACT|nr:MAG: hypothetical protein A2Y99_00715 [Candidatus Gottesmanbacteria bacterium RBG_13_37_7]